MQGVHQYPVIYGTMICSSIYRKAHQEILATTAKSMNRQISPGDYDAWYETPRGAWAGAAEAEALLRLAEIGIGTHALDVGCGSGWFSRRFADAGARVTAVDRDPAMLAYARARDGRANYLQGDMLALPLPDKSFDIVTAVTSLCFVADESRALTEMARVARVRIVLGLLHRRSLLCLKKRGRGVYAGARWHTRADIERLVAGLPGVRDVETETLLFWPGGPRLGRALEALPELKRFGGFMAVRIELQFRVAPGARNAKPETI